jgi:hypothetical protein
VLARQGDNGTLLGFQSLIAQSAGVSLARMSIRTQQEVGVGRNCFQITRAAATEAGLESIEAYI